MKKIKFDFLDSMQLKEVEKTPLQIKATLTPAKGADFRLFSDGAIFPHEDLIKRHQLEYQDKDSDLPEFGYDVFLANEWAQYPVGLPNVVCIARVSKHLPSVDLFSRVKYTIDNKPKNSVLAQKNTSGENLIKYLETVYCDFGESIFVAGKAYVDLKIVKQLDPLSNGIYNIPKKFVKGEKAGTPKYERRENIDVFVLDIIHENVDEPVKLKNSVLADQLN